MIKEMRQIDRELRRLMGEESPNFERVRFFATSPDERRPGFHVPSNLDFHEKFSIHFTPARQSPDEELLATSPEVSGPCFHYRSTPRPEAPAKVGKDTTERTAYGAPHHEGSLDHRGIRAPFSAGITSPTALCSRQVPPRAPYEQPDLVGPENEAQDQQR